MKNCFVTKLKGVVNDNTLTKLGYFNVYWNGNTNPTQDTQTLQLEFSSDVVAEIFDGVGEIKPGGDMSAQGVQSISIPANTKTMLTVVSENGCHVRIGGKYDIKVCETRGSSHPMEVNISDFKYSQASILNLFSCEYAKGSINDIPASVYSLQVGGNQNLTGDLSVFEGRTNLTLLQLNGSKDITGDIISLGGMVDATMLICFNLSITGSVESLMETLHKNGKRTPLNSFSMYGMHGRVTLNGIVQGLTVPTQKVDFSENSIVIKNYFNDSVVASCSVSGGVYTWTYA